MEKRLCQLNRQAIHNSLPKLHRLFVEPQFFCRSCARACADANLLCKPTPIAPKSCQSPNPIQVNAQQDNAVHSDNGANCALAKEAQGECYVAPCQPRSVSTAVSRTTEQTIIDERVKLQDKAQRKIAKIQKKQRELVIKLRESQHKQDKLQKKELKYAQKLQKAQHKLQQLREI